ncbi:hypothetical protein Plhal304r1_c008g0033701 [Plasmopara halstedii]
MPDPSFLDRALSLQIENTDGTWVGEIEPSSVEDGSAVVAEMRAVLEQIPEAISLYKSELEKLLGTFIKSHESEQRLVHRTKEFLEQIRFSHDVMVRDQEEESEALAQKKNITSELDAVLRQISSTRQIGLEKTQKVNNLRGKLEALQEEVSKMALPFGNSGEVLLNEDQELQIATLRNQRAECARDVETKTISLQDIRQETANLFTLVQEEEAKNARFEENQTNVVLQSQEVQSLLDKEVRRKTRLEQDLRLLKQSFERLQSDNAALESLKKENEESLYKKELITRESKLKMDKYSKQYDALYRTTHSLTEAVQLQWQRNEELHKENVQVEHELNVKEEEIEAVARAVLKTEKLMEIGRQQLHDTEAKRSEFESKNEALKLELDNMINVTLESEKKQSDLLTKKLKELLREREVLNKMLVKANDRGQATFDLKKIKENTIKNMQNEINGMKSYVRKQRTQVQLLVLEREKYENEASKANQKFMTSLEEAKLQDLQAVSLQQKILESESRLKQQQNLYEAVRTDRNLYSKQLIEGQEEIGDFKRKFKIISHQIQQLKEEITSKDHALVKEHFDHHKVDKEKEILKNELLRIKKQIHSSEQIILNQEQEVTKLAKIIQQADEEKQRQIKEYGCVVRDRDTLRQQLIQRNEEMSVLYEKIKIQKSTLSNGFSLYNEKVKEVSDLKSRIDTLTHERDLSSNQLSHESSLQQELLRLEKKLLQEKTKIRALLEEHDHPLNVHRWRKLEGSDPKRFEMIRKHQRMQKKLIRKHEETTIKDLLIVEKEKLYVELKTILARQPGAEVAEQLLVYKETLKGKQTQMKQMEDELQMYKMQVNEYRDELGRIDTEKQQIQQEWINWQLNLYSKQFRCPKNEATVQVHGDSASHGNQED